jgi:hypothetical protein
MLVNVVERAVWTVAIAIFITGAFFTPQLVTSSPAVDQASLASAVAPSSAETIGHFAEVREDGREPADGPSGFTDLYGNEVTDAVATYTFDQTGSLYELHSPQTELPRLGIPKS